MGALCFTGPFLTHDFGRHLVRCFGASSYPASLRGILVPAAFELRWSSSFAGIPLLGRVRFNPDSRLFTIEQSVFAWSEITAITIPASAQVRAESCFVRCGLLCEVMFERGLHLGQINDFAFERSDFQEITHPESIDLLSESAFVDCRFKGFRYSVKIDIFTF
jgi:hypothetical protein